MLMPDLTTGFKADLNNEFKPCAFIDPNLLQTIYIRSNCTQQQYLTTIHPLSRWLHIRIIIIKDYTGEIDKGVYHTLGKCL